MRHASKTHSSNWNNHIVNWGKSQKLSEFILKNKIFGHFTLTTLLLLMKNCPWFVFYTMDFVHLLPKIKETYLGLN
jgi:hypothetical protein